MPKKAKNEEILSATKKAIGNPSTAKQSKGVSSKRVSQQLLVDDLSGSSSSEEVSAESSMAELIKEIQMLKQIAGENKERQVTHSSIRDRI